MAVTDAAGASDRTPDGREVAGLGPSASPDVSALLPAGAHSVPQARHPGGPSPQHPPPPQLGRRRKTKQDTRLMAGQVQPDLEAETVWLGPSSPSSRSGSRSCSFLRMQTCGRSPPWASSPGRGRGRGGGGLGVGGRKASESSGMLLWSCV